MASGISGISGAGNLQDRDYSIPHRPPPAPPFGASSATSPNRSPEITQQQWVRQQHQQHKRQKSSGSGGIVKERTRKNSLSGLLRSGSSKHKPEAVTISDPLTAPPLPPPPPPFGAQPPIPHDDPNKHFHFGEAATVTSTAYSTPRSQPPQNLSFDQSEEQPPNSRIFRSLSHSVSREAMLRRASKARQQQQQQAELERREREAQMLPKQPPRLPSHHPLMAMPTFGGEDARPDSIAMFNGQVQQARSPPPSSYTHNYAHNPVQTAANFSRPGVASRDNSSSPAYAIRGASGSVSPPPAVNATVNRDEPPQRTGSMTNRGRYDYTAAAAQAGHVNSPRRLRRRKDPTPFNVLVVGTKGSGKSSFISLLKHSLAMPSTKREIDRQSAQIKDNFASIYVETEMEGERVGVTLWDSAGLEKSIVDLQLREMTTFIESKFEETFAEEQKVMRSPGFRDTHIHCVFLVLDPLRLDANIESASPSKGGLDDALDVQVLRALWEKTVVIPVIAKADTLTTKHMSHLKRAVWKSIKYNSMNPLDALELEEDEEEQYADSDVLVEEDEHADIDPPIQNPNRLSSSSNSSSSSSSATVKTASKRVSHMRHASQAGALADEEPYLPLSVLSPDPYTLPKSGVATESELSRVFPWGSASPLNPEHCDFSRLRDSVFLEWRSDLRELSRTRWYEQWRTSRLRNVPGTKMRIKGGVTPVAAVPKEGRGDVRNFSSGGVGTAGVPRTVSGAAQSTAGPGTVPVGMAVSTPASAY